MNDKPLMWRIHILRILCVHFQDGGREITKLHNIPIQPPLCHFHCLSLTTLPHTETIQVGQQLHACYWCTPLGVVSNVVSGLIQIVSSVLNNILRRRCEHRWRWSIFLPFPNPPYIFRKSYKQTGRLVMNKWWAYLRVVLHSKWSRNDQVHGHV